jgi:hypothetical protein
MNRPQRDTLNRPPFVPRRPLRFILREAFHKAAPILRDLVDIACWGVIAFAIGYFLAGVVGAVESGRIAEVLR